MPLPLSLSMPILVLVHLFLLVPLARSQACDQSIGEIILEDLTSLNPIYLSSTTLSSSATITTSGTALTTADPASHGSLFFTSPTDFQGTGGFSLKFVLQTSGVGGDVWEAIVAGSTDNQFASSPFLGSAVPPYGPGEQSNGIAGWSRLAAFVVEFDAHDSGSTESDNDDSHLAMYLSGTEVCKTSLAVDLSSADKYTVWLDFDGFATTASVRISTPNSDTRPTDATLECVADIWGTLSMSRAAHVGFASYNPVSEAGTEHRLVDEISIADGYKPYDLGDCASYSKCSAKVQSGLCAKVRDDGDCDIIACTGGWVWDVAGDECCAFVERTSFVVTDNAGLAEGAIVTCTQSRSTIAYLTTSDRCS